jgi:hypothetical protein
MSYTKHVSLYISAKLFITVIENPAAEYLELKQQKSGVYVNVQECKYENIRTSCAIVTSM